MRSLVCLALLSTTLVLAPRLHAEQSVPAPVEPTVKAAPAAESIKPEQGKRQAAPATPYERAVRSLTLAGGSRLHFDSEVAGDDGQVQRATGVMLAQQTSVTVRTQPDPDLVHDGAWLIQNGAFLKQSPSGFVETEVKPASIAMFFDALPSLPTSESGLARKSAPVGNVAGTTCQPRSVKLSAKSALRYSELRVCVDEAGARIVKLQASTPDGGLIVTLHQEDAPSSTVTSGGVDWTSEFPMAEPGERKPKLKYKDCPGLVSVLPQGCEGFEPTPAKETEHGALTEQE